MVTSKNYEHKSLRKLDISTVNLEMRGQHARSVTT